MGTRYDMEDIESKPVKPNYFCLQGIEIVCSFEKLLMKMYGRETGAAQGLCYSKERGHATN